MMPDLRSRLKAVADKPRREETPCACRGIDTRGPLCAGISGVTPEHARWLGLDFPAFDPRRALFLDTETTGLRGAGTVAFLVGLGWIEGDEFVVRQLLMRDYPEEPSQLAAVAEALARFDCVISFNGKSFDMPLLRDRFSMARMRDGWRELPQLDLLHAARRTWKLRLGSCTLGALEEAVLGITREGDLPGAEVPERFFSFLKTGDETLLDDVLRHNEQDIRTLAVLLARLSEAYREPEAQQSLLDVFSIGRAMERCGENDRARRCFQVASVSALSKQARLHLARSYRRDRDFDSAARTYQGMIDRGEADADVYTALAILLERHLGDARQALTVTEKALWRFAGRDFLHGTDTATLERLERRRARLKHKIETGG